MIYVYDHHLGYLYTASYELDYEDLFCETCGDSDMLVAVINSEQDIDEFKKTMHEDGYTQESISSFIDNLRRRFNENNL